jgi:hypothetical protein
MADEVERPKVETTHPAYDRIVTIWKKVRDVIEGEPAILHPDNVRSYLPPPPGMQPGPEQSINDKLSNRLETRYDFYKTFADFPEITAPMVQGIMGLVHEKPPEYKLPDKLQYLAKKATGDGDSLEELWQLVTQELFYTGRIGLLADVQGGLGLQGAQMHLCQYTAETIRNWRLSQKCEGEQAQMVVLGEGGMQADPDDDFKHIEVMQYRELRLVAGEYWARVWQKVEDGKVEPVVTPDTNPQGWTRPEIFGRGFDRIPLTVINATDIGFQYGPVPAWPMAKRALAIFRKSADANRSLYIKGDPQAWVTGVAEDDIPTEIGGSSIWGLPDSEAKVGYLDIDGQGIPLQLKAIDSEYSRFYGEAGHLLESASKGAEAAEALRIRQGMKQVSVKALVKNAGAGLQESLRMIGRLSGMSDNEVEEITFDPNVNFTEGQMGYQELLFLMQAKDLAIRNGVPLSNETIHAQMRKRQLTHLTYEQELDGSTSDIDTAFGLIGRLAETEDVSDNNSTRTGETRFGT